MAKILQKTLTGTLCLLCMGLLTACQEKPAPAPEKTAEVGVAVVESALMHPVRNMVGHTVPSRQAEVRPQVRGIVREVLFTEGGQVTEGDVLYRIEPESYQAAVNSAKGALAKAESSLEVTRLKADRSGDLRKVNAVSQQNDDDAQAAWRQAKAEVASARAALDKAEIDLRRTEITAPISGYIGRSTVTEGALVTENQAAPLTSIFQMDPMYVDVPLTALEMNRLRSSVTQGVATPGAPEANSSFVGDDVTVYLQLGDGSWYEHVGKLRFADVSVNPGTGSILCRAAFPNPSLQLLPGLYVNVTGTTERPLPTMLVPQKAVQRDGRGEPYVLVVTDDNKVDRRAISTGRTVGDQWQVRDGVMEGERIVVDGLHRAKPGREVLPFLMDSTSENGELERRGLEQGHGQAGKQAILMPWQKIIPKTAVSQALTPSGNATDPLSSGSAQGIARGFSDKVEG